MFFINDLELGVKRKRWRIQMTKKSNQFNLQNRFRIEKREDRKVIKYIV